MKQRSSSSPGGVLALGLILMVLLAQCAVASGLRGNDADEAVAAVVENSAIVAEGVSALQEIDGERDLAACKYNLRKIAQRMFPRWNMQTFIQRDPSRPHMDEGKGPRRFKLNTNLPKPFRNATCAIPGSRYLSWVVPSMPKSGIRHAGGCLAKFNNQWATSPTVAVFDCNGKQIACRDGLVRWQGRSNKQDYLVVMYADGMIPDRYWFDYGGNKVTRNYHCDVWNEWDDFKASSNGESSDEEPNDQAQDSENENDDDDDDDNDDDYDEENDTTWTTRAT